MLNREIVKNPNLFKQGIDTENVKYSKPFQKGIPAKTFKIKAFSYADSRHKKHKMFMMNLFLKMGFRQGKYKKFKAFSDEEVR